MAATLIPQSLGQAGWAATPMHIASHLELPVLTLPSGITALPVVAALGLDCWGQRHLLLDLESWDRDTSYPPKALTSLKTSL